MNFYELMTKYVNKEIDFKTRIRFKFIDESDCTFRYSGDKSLGDFLSNEKVKEDGLVFEIVKQKKKMYVHEYFDLNEMRDDRETINVLYKLSKETWEEYKKGYNFLLVETRENEVDCD